MLGNARDRRVADTGLLPVALRPWMTTSRLNMHPNDVKSASSRFGASLPALSLLCKTVPSLFNVVDRAAQLTHIAVSVPCRSHHAC